VINYTIVDEKAKYRVISSL